MTQQPGTVMRSPSTPRLSKCPKRIIPYYLRVGRRCRRNLPPYTMHISRKRQPISNQTGVSFTPSTGSSACGGGPFTKWQQRCLRKHSRSGTYGAWQRRYISHCSRHRSGLQGNVALVAPSLRCRRYIGISKTYGGRAVRNR